MAVPHSSFLHTGIAAAMVGLFAVAPATAGTGIAVTMHQAKVVKLSTPADTIIVGNQAIADATVQDGTTIVLTGKGFGVTNIVVLDKNGNAIMDEQVSVQRQDAASVRVYRQSQVQTLSCTPYCESAYKSDAEILSEAAMNAGR